MGAGPTELDFAATVGDDRLVRIDFPTLVNGCTHGISSAPGGYADPFGPTRP
jgi:hypothetical protein